MARDPRKQTLMELVDSYAVACVCDNILVASKLRSEVERRFEELGDAIVEAMTALADVAPGRVEGFCGRSAPLSMGGVCGAPIERVWRHTGTLNYGHEARP